MRQALLIPVLAFLVGVSVVPARSDGGIVRYVDDLTDCAGLAPCYATIMDAVGAAVPLDIIEIFPGVYHEAVLISSKGHIVLRGHGAGAMPTIVAPAGASAIRIDYSAGVQLLGLVLEAPDAAGVYGNGGLTTDALIEGNLISSRLGVQFMTGCGTVRNNTIIGGGIGSARSRCHVVEGNTVTGGIEFGDIYEGPDYNQVLNNVVLSGGIDFDGRPAISNVVASNVVLDGDITVYGNICSANEIRANVVRGGGIQIGGGARENTIEGNFASASPGTGILVRMFPTDAAGGNNSILRNTSVDNSGCDLNDVSTPRDGAPPNPVNHWVENRYRTACGAAVPVAP